MDPFATRDDGSAKDPAAYRAAIQKDPVRLKALAEDPALSAAVLGGDANAMQAMLRKVRAASNLADDTAAGLMMTSMERMRAKCTVPKDSVTAYEEMNKNGLQYGPAFRLLTDIHIMDHSASTAAAPRE